MALHNAFGELNLEATQQQVLAAVTTGNTNARTTFETAQRDGLAFFASTGRVQVSPSGHLRVAVTNPAGSRDMYLSHLEAFVSSGPAYARLRYNPTSGVPTSPVRPANNFRLGIATVSAVELRADVNVTTPLDGGIDTGTDFGLGGGSTTLIALGPLSVPPNATVAFNCPFVGAADAVLTAYWWEEAA